MTMRLLTLLEADLYYYGWIDDEGRYHEGGHGVLILEAFRDEILSDLGVNPNDPAAVKKALNRAFENDFYEYGFNHGWVRVYTEGGEIGFQMKEARRDAIRKVAEILQSVFDYKVMLDTAYAPFQRFPDPKMALRWLNQRFRGVVTEAIEIPGTEYGYWITDRGEFIQVDFEDHGRVAERYFRNHTPRDPAGLQAMRKGWIRVVETDDGLGMGLSFRTVTKAALYRLLELIKYDRNKTIYRFDRVELGGGLTADNFAGGAPSYVFTQMAQVNKFLRDLLKSKGALTEAPLGDFQVDPDLEQNLASQRRKWHGYERELQHFPDPDVKAIRNPAVVKKIATRFARIPQNINLYFWANPDPDYDWHTQKGEVDLDWIAHNMGEQVAQRFARMRDTKNRINIMHTGNLRDEQYVPMRSPWMMAHRIAHVLCQDHRIQNRFEQFVIDLTRKVYGVKWPDINGQYGEIFRRDYFGAYGKILGHLLGRMRSARQEKLVQFREWIYERFAQYLMTGRVRLNRTLPRQIDRGDNRMRPGAERLVPKLIGHFEQRIQQIFEKVLNDSIGKYYVM